MAEPRWAAWSVLLAGTLAVVLTMVSLGEARGLASVSPSGSSELAPLQHFSIGDGEAAALQELRISLHLRDREWPEASDPCSTWKGVRCEDGHVVEVGLSGLIQSSEAAPSTASIDALRQLPFLRCLNASGFTPLRSLPVWLGGMVFLQVVDFRSSSLSGSIPSSIGNLSHLRILRLANNSLTGSIPSTLGDLTKLTTLDLSGNKLQGRIPESLGSLEELEELNLSANRLQGIVPVQLARLAGLQRLFLAHNSLHGHIPQELLYLKSLTVLDLTDNSLTGALFTAPSDAIVLFSNNCFSLTDVVGSQIRGSHCGSVLAGKALRSQRMMEEILTFPPNSTSSGGGHLGAVLGGVFGGLGLIFLVAIFVFYVIQHERKVEAKARARRAARQRPVGITSIKPLSGRSINVSRFGEAFSYSQLQQATGMFDLSNMIMAGHTGDLYKGVLHGNSHVVVKRIDVGRFKKDLYISELEFFGRVSHPRLVPLLGHCLEREDEKLLVYKYMPNGDLAYALHRKESPSRPEDVLQSLDWITRLKIAIGVAEALVYLHHEISPPLVHRDIKASSILLDDKFEVRLGSLTDVRIQQGEHQSGLISRFLRLSSRSSEQGEIGSGSGSPVASCAYDVFCFGKVLLELVSGKLGISGSIDPGADTWLEEWALPHIDIHNRELLLELMDPSLIVHDDLLEEVWATAIIAKSCLNTKASRRPNMKHILKALENPQKVVRDDHSGPMKSRHSSYGSWNSALFGGWRHCSSESVFGFQNASLREEHSMDHNNAARIPSGPGEDSRQHRRPGSREIFPVPLALPTPTNQESDGTES